jgi:YhcH/YjgK/YiaL family protein
MIIDKISNSHLYHTVHPRFKRAFDYIQQGNADTLPVGRYELDGTALFVLVQEYETKLKEQGFWESHRRYIDLQYVARGVEGMGYANIEHMQHGEYDSGKDLLLPKGEGDIVTLHSGCFALLMPQDVHMPGMAIGNPVPVRKIVVKIAIE